MQIDEDFNWKSKLGNGCRLGTDIILINLFNWF